MSNLCVCNSACITTVLFMIQCLCETRIAIVVGSQCCGGLIRTNFIHTISLPLWCDSKGNEACSLMHKAEKYRGRRPAWFYNPVLVMLGSSI